MNRWILTFFIFVSSLSFSNQTTSLDIPAPQPLLNKTESVDWWFIFKFNAQTFPQCESQRFCPFGGTVQNYPTFGQQYVVWNRKTNSMVEGKNCLGTTENDPLGATFSQIFHTPYFYLIWNDQFFNLERPIAGVENYFPAPWAHSKGMLAWNELGEGIILQVSTPGWPAVGNVRFLRQTDENTLGCMQRNNLKLSQHFFALRLTKEDTIKILKALNNAGVPTDPKNRQIVQNGGPKEIQELVNRLGSPSKAKTPTMDTLSSGVKILSKPPEIHVSPWHFASSMLGGVGLRVAYYWENKAQNVSTTANTKISCWDKNLKKPGPVEIAVTGSWKEKQFQLFAFGAMGNHAKIGISLDPEKFYTIFSDMNQGILNGPNCGLHQNGRGGLFFIVQDKPFWEAMTNLLKGETLSTDTEEVKSFLKELKEKEQLTGKTTEHP